MLLRANHDPAVTVTLRILKPTVCAGMPVQPGDIVENVKYSDQAKLVGMGKAEIVENSETRPDPPKRKARAKRKAPVNRMVESEDLDDRGE